MVSKVMRSLTMKYIHVITSIEQARDVEKLPLNELSGSLQAHEARFHMFTNKPKYKILYMKGESSGS